MLAAMLIAACQASPSLMYDVLHITSADAAALLHMLPYTFPGALQNGFCGPNCDTLVAKVANTLLHSAAFSNEASQNAKLLQQAVCSMCMRYDEA